MFKGKQVCVTGGAGFIGSHLARRLHREGANVRVVDNLSSGYIGRIQDVLDDVEFVVGDLRMERNARNAVDGCDYVFHLAANMGGIGYILEGLGNDANIISDNALIDMNVIRACRDFQIKRMFYASSACIYPLGLQVKLGSPGLKESDAIPAEPDSPYGWEKLFMEQVCASFQRDTNLEVRIARFHNAYGPWGNYDPHKSKVIMAFCRKALELDDGGTFQIWGDGKAERSFIYIGDLIDGIIQLFASDLTTPLNLGTHDPISMTDLAKLVLSIAGKTNITFEYQLDKPQGVRSRDADLTMLREQLQWEPTTSLEDGISATYDWLKRTL